MTDIIVFLLAWVIIYSEVQKLKICAKGEAPVGALEAFFSLVAIATIVILVLSN